MAYNPRFHTVRIALCSQRSSCRCPSLVLPPRRYSQAASTARSGMSRACWWAQTVRASSPSLIFGSVTGQTNERGQLYFPSLPPGSYLLEVTMAKFAPYRASDIRIGAGAAIEHDPVLQVARQVGAVDVTGSRRDTSFPGFGARFDSETITGIPTRRNGMFAFIMASPGISPTSQDDQLRLGVRLRCRPEHVTSSTARTSPRRATASHARSRASTSFRKCTSSRLARRPNTATSRAR